MSDWQFKSEPSTRQMALCNALGRSYEDMDWDAMLAQVVELRADLAAARRDGAEPDDRRVWCAGCGVRWQSPEGFLLAGVVHLCGDCWRKVQPMLHSGRRGSEMP